MLKLVTGGLRIGKLGNSSVRYEIGLFGQGEDIARTEGHFVHVFVDGKIVEEGGPELAHKLEAEGYAAWTPQPA